MYLKDVCIKWEPVCAEGLYKSRIQIFINNLFLQIL